MRAYFSLLFSLTILSGALLLFGFNYGLVTVLYHVIIMSFGYITVFAVAFVLAVTLPKRLFPYLLHSLCLSALLTVVLVYLFIHASNFFWKKTITVQVINNYISKFGDFVSSLPVERWIFYTSLILVLAISVFIYYLCKPQATRFFESLERFRNRRSKVQGLVIFSVLVVGVFLFKNSILHGKRVMHFREEPVLQFALGNIWGEGNEVAFDKARYLSGLQDNACLDSLNVKPKPEDQLVVVILVDALRSDHLPMYGYKRNTAPFLDSLYKANSLYTVQHAFSPSTNTVGGIAGLFFSRDWTEFGYNGLNIMKYLKQANYTTYAFLTGYHRDWFGLSALYRGSSDYYYESPKDPSVPPDDDLVTLKKITQTTINPRSFAYIHLLSTHTIGKKDPSFKKFIPDKIGLGTDQKTALVNNYDNGILQADFVIRKIFDKLKQDRLLEKSIIYIVSDHGEMFGEDGRWSHGGSVHQSLLTVPFLIYDSNKAWYTNLEAATLKDVAPTIIDRLGYPIPQCWEGTSLHLPVQNFTMEVNSVAECEFPFGNLRREGNAFELQIRDRSNVVRKKLVLKDRTWTDTVANH